MVTVRRRVALSAAAAAFVVAAFVSTSAQSPCEALVSLVLPAGRVTAAALVAAQSSTPAFCRVEATLTPSSDSAVGIEVWLPERNWNGWFQGVGNRGWGGSINTRLLAQAVTAGYAAASTDTGHRGAGADFALGHPQRVVDAGYRAVHEMTVQARAVTASYYGAAPQRSAWNGCSLGGRQGLMEAMRFPGDYDVVVAGDPASNLTDLYAARLSWWNAAQRDGRAVLTADALALLHRASTEACDAYDGVRDGVIEDPRSCTVDAGALACRDGATGGCLQPDQVAAARALYADVRHPVTQRRLSTGFAPGSERGWTAVAGSQPENNAIGLFRFVTRGQRDWQWRPFDVAAEVDHAVQAAATLDAVETDIGPFLRRGGKLLLYHGWADPQTPPGNTIAWYERALAASGEAGREGMRLFMVPGMGHCDGGAGTDSFDAVDVATAWHTTGRAPARVLASRLEQGRVTRTRPLCAYPFVARWNERDSFDDAGSFDCVAPAATPGAR